VEAEALYKQNISILERAPETHKSAFLMILGRLEGLYLKQGRKTEASAISARIHSLHESLTGKEVK
jgi:hypothetical protein